MKTLEINPLVRIAPVQLKHAENMFRWMSDSDVAKNVGLRQKPSRQKTKAWIGNAARDNLICAHAIYLEKHHVGNVVIDKIDAYLRTARLSIYIGEKAARRQGVATTAIYLALKRAFATHKLHKICLTVHEQNTGAIAGYTKFGFVVEGILRDEFRMNNRRINAFFMSLLRNEFNQIQTHIRL